MTLVTAQDLNRLAGQLSALADLMRGDPDCRCNCKTRADHAYRVAKDAHGASTTQGGRASKGDHADPTFGQYINPDPTDRWLRDLSVYAHATSRFTQELARVVHDLGTVTSTNPRELTKTGSGDCMACGRYCSGAVNDRLRAGFCNACRMAYKRAGSPDRFEFCRNTPAHDAPIEGTRAQA